MPRGYVAFVLHAHLPFVRHPEDEHHLEERWLYEAVAESYLPLLEVFQRLDAEGVPFELTLSISPPLLVMLRDDLLRGRIERYMSALEELASREANGEERVARLGVFYADRMKRMRALWDSCDRDLPGALRKLEERGRLQLLTSGATHGFLPGLRAVPAGVRAQIAVAVAEHTRALGTAPRGIWLPECGYYPGLDALLADHGLRAFVAETHALLHATPIPPHGIYSHAFTPRGVAIFARDPACSRAVWSRDEGYPGHPSYRDFYRDLGYELPIERVRPYVGDLPGGVRMATGFKHRRITGATDDKQIYERDRALVAVEAHAQHFVAARRAQIAELAPKIDREPIVLAPYDCELFGHWWFEGPDWLEHTLRALATDDVARTTTLSEHLARYPTGYVVSPAYSTWGEEGYAEVWCDGDNAALWRHVLEVTAANARLCEAHGKAVDAGSLRGRALRQACRETLLLQSSDFPFILRAGTATSYIHERVRTHVGRFRRAALIAERGGDQDDEAWLADIESRDNLFAQIDIGAFCP